MRTKLWRLFQAIRVWSYKRDRWFESGSLQRRVSCKPHFRGASVYDRRNSLMIGRPQALSPAAGQADCEVGVEAVDPSLLGDAGQVAAKGEAVFN